MLLLRVKALKHKLLSLKEVDSKNFNEEYGEIIGKHWEHIDTGYWYTLSVPINVTGDFNYAITYERSDDNGI